MLWPKRWLQPYGGRWLEPVRLLGACKMHPTMHLTSGHKLKQSEGEKPATQVRIDRESGSPFAEERPGRCCATLRAGVDFAEVSAAEVSGSGLVVDIAGLPLAL